MSKSGLAIFGGDPVAKMPPLKSSVGIDELSSIEQVIKGGGMLSEFRGGSKVREFEKAFAEYVGARYAIATTSGTTALHASVAALDLQPDDEVIVPAMTFISTASVVLQQGAKVVFVDVDQYYGLDPLDLERKISKHTKAIIPVHLYGQPVDMDRIREIAHKHSLIVIEDACQSHGATYKSKKTGTLGDIGCFSFFQSKNMTTGEGGMIVTSNERLYTQIRLRREHGSPRSSNTWYNYQLLGFNYNMTELQGAVGIVQLKKLDDMNKDRMANAELYNSCLAGLGLTLPLTRPNSTHVRHNYPVLLADRFATKRNFFVKALRAEGIPIDIAYPAPLYESHVFKELGYTANCYKSENYTSRIFTLFTDRSIDSQVISDTAIAIKKVLTYMDEA